jgi:uncharacterized protein (DUF1778 family)
MLCARFSIMPGTITTSLLNWRATPEQRGTVQKAAQVCKLTMSDLMRSAALEYAQRLLEGTQR